jgi:hypothetical protein
MAATTASVKIDRGRVDKLGPTLGLKLRFNARREIGQSTRPHRNNPHGHPGIGESSDRRRVQSSRDVTHRGLRPQTPASLATAAKIEVDPQRSFIEGRTSGAVKDGLPAASPVEPRSAAKAETPHPPAAARGNSHSSLAKRRARTQTGQPVAPAAEPRSRIRARELASSRNP